MSTLAEIEAAIGELPPEQWQEIRRWMDSRAPKAANSSQVNWGESQAMMRQRSPGTRLSAEAVLGALAAVRGYGLAS